VTSSNEKQNEKRRKRYAEDPEHRERHLARSLAHYHAHKDAITEGLRHRYATDPEFRQKRLKKNPATARRTSLKSLYGISLEDYARLLAEQGGVCAICLRQPAERLCVDHCHATGKVRGLLCRTCNTGLGCYRDDPSLLTTAAAYLTKASS
jgi:Recombination endonuclease VII